MTTKAFTRSKRNNSFSTYARFTGYESPVIFVDSPESPYWTTRALMLEIDLRRAIGQVDTDALVADYNRVGLDIVSRCHAFEIELEYARRASGGAVRNSHKADFPVSTAAERTNALPVDQPRTRFFK